MPNPFVLLPNAVSQQQPQIIYAQVSTAQPAPASFTDPLYVIRPAWNPTYYWSITDWPACHGSTLPAQGAACVLVQDTTGALRCVWWDADGAQFAPTGTAGGDLSGGFPDPTVATVLGGETPITTATQLGGVLTGTLPNPTGPPRVTVLPGSPSDGAEVYYEADITNGVLWHLRYNAGSGSTFKWEFLGGAPLSAADNAQYGPLTNTGFANPSSMQIAVALAGEYMIDGGVSGAINSSSASDYIDVAFNISGAYMSSNLGTLPLHAIAQAEGGVQGSLPRIRQQFNAGGYLTLGAATDGPEYYVRGLSVTLTPVRVS